MKIVCNPKTSADVLLVARLTKIINNDPELAGSIIVIEEDSKPQSPRINVGTIGHISRGRVNVFGLGGAIMGILAQRDFSYSLPEIKILPQHISRSSDKNHFEKLSQVHSARSRQKIVRTGLTPRVVKRKRVRFHFRFQ